MEMNDFVPLNTIERFIEQHPEDSEKWLDFLRNPANSKPLPVRRRNRNDTDVSDPALLTQYHNIYNDIDEINNNNVIGCIFCKKPWSATQTMPTISLICGHKFHTVCYYMREYDTDDSHSCFVEGCEVNTFNYAISMVKSRRKVRRTVEDNLMDSIIVKPEFKVDLKELKLHTSKINKSINSVTKLISRGRKDILRKYLFTIQHIQKDMDDKVKEIRESDAMKLYKAQISKSRSLLNRMFRKYHISFRDMRHRNLIGGTWRIRYIMEYHRSWNNFYKLGIRIKPGKHQWKEPAADSDVEEEEV